MTKMTLKISVVCRSINCESKHLNNLHCALLCITVFTCD